MQQRRQGPIYHLDGIFHLEGDLKTLLPDFTHAEAETFRELIHDHAMVCDLEVVFFRTGARAFDVMVRKDSRFRYRDTAWMDAVERLGEPAIADFLRGATRPLKALRVRAAQIKGMRGNLQAFSRGIKQRSAILFNRTHGNRGRVWRDPVTIFDVPDEPAHLGEVAAFAIARPEFHCGEDVRRWPSTWAEAREGGSRARDQLRRIFRNQAPAADNADRLEQLWTEVRDKMEAFGEGPPRRGGRRHWRPTCETEGAANPRVEPYEPGYLEARRRRYRERFYAMLERFAQFSKETGLDYVPWGYEHDEELRRWAGKLRQQYFSGHLAQWQVDALSHTRLLESVRGGDKTPPIPNDQWWKHVDELKAFREQHGHTRVSRNNAPNRTLFNWVWTQRTLRRKGHLHPEKIRVLDTLGFAWDPRGRDAAKAASESGSAR